MKAGIKKILETHKLNQWEDVTFEQLVEELELDEAYEPHQKKQAGQQQPFRRFRRSPEYAATYDKLIKSNQTYKNKLHHFMEVKRHNPNTPVNANDDRPFAGEGAFRSVIPNIAHYHISYNISIVYRVVNEGGEPIVYLYGFYTHDDLGTGMPANKNRQKVMAGRFKNFTFENARRLRDRLGMHFLINQ